jgi:hypothetical protein
MKTRQNRYTLLLGVLCLLTIWTCKKERIQRSPEITNLSISKDTSEQGSAINDLYINFNYLNQYGELGADSGTDSLRIILRHLDFPSIFPSNEYGTYYVYPDNGGVIVENGKIKFGVYSACCIYPINVNPPCASSPGTFQKILLELEYINNLGYEIPRDTIPLVLDCN